ncbi:MAG TPA: glycosyltransferase [Thermoanaerobaculia bacterium]|nr:glycosyltransferase [Thermoanaerobaculia bacterium]
MQPPHRQPQDTAVDVPNPSPPPDRRARANEGREGDAVIGRQLVARLSSRLRRAAPRILFVGHFQRDGGSSNALLGYARAAGRRGIDLRVSSLVPLHPEVERAVPVADPEWRADYLVFVFEDWQYLSPPALEQLQRSTPRSRRLVIDQDGKYSPPTSAGADSNHRSDDEWRSWKGLFERLSDVILQPTLAAPQPGVESFLYFAAPPRIASCGTNRSFDVVYVGNNWYRWQDLVWFGQGIAPIRDRLGRIAVCGKWWDDETERDHPEQTWSDPRLLKRLGIELLPAVAFGDVVETMSRGRLNPQFVRPVLNELALVTPRMFEAFAADTVPVFPPHLRHVDRLYGQAIEPLVLPERPAAAVLQMLERHSEYAALAKEIAGKLEREHSYDARLSQLLGFFG